MDTALSEALENPNIILISLLPSFVFLYDAQLKIVSLLEVR